MSYSTGGQLRQVQLGGYTWDFGAEVEPTFNPGGEEVTDTERTNGGIVTLYGKREGVLGGLEIKLFSKNDTLERFTQIKEDCVTAPISCLIEFADGSKWTSGGVVIVVDGSEDGHTNMRTGATTIKIISATGFKRIS